jgi:hypothetical protein
MDVLLAAQVMQVFLFNGHIDVVLPKVRKEPEHCIDFTLLVGVAEYHQSFHSGKFSDFISLGSENGLKNVYIEPTELLSRAICFALVYSGSLALLRV